MKFWSIRLSLFINYWIFAILLNSVGTVILQVQNSFAISESAAGILEAFKDLSIAGTCFLVASFITRIGYKRAMLIALGLVCIMCLLAPQVPAFWMNKLMFAAIGFSFALVKVSIFATIGLVTNSSREHVSLMNFIESFFMIGVLSGNYIFSRFIDDANPGSLVWLNVYYVLAGFAFLAFVLLFFAPLDESSVTKNVANEDSISASSDFISMLRLAYRPLVLIFIVCAFLYVLIEQSIMSWLPTFNSKILNLSTTLSIQMASILAASTALGRFVAGFIFKKVDWYRIIVVSLIFATCLVLMALPLAKNIDATQAGATQIDSWFSAPLVAFVFPLIGFFIAPIYPAINSVILSALPKHDHASMAGLIVVSSALGGTTGSIITGTLFEHFGGTVAFYCSLIPITIILVALHLFKKQTDKLESNRALQALDV
ncbi:MFS transporter [Agarilytica rhodophyticola]|uniref:MFS transporter n=1 Tax=Agarilytica rhodophyticola TaxID=1737490 RepID=UPI000B346467|nr:MFS transporter [Agarilytica rhodophyticola]